MKINDKVFCTRNRIIGTIGQIDNKCSKLYNKSYDNPGHLEYYIRWPKGAWTRHYVHELDAGRADGIIPYTKAARILYRKK